MEIMPRRFYLDDIFDDFIPTKRDASMKCDIYEKDGDYHIEMDVPGFNKEEISIDVKDGYLTIKAEKNNEMDDSDEDKNYIRRERSYSKYERSFYLGDLDQDKIDAEFTNGMLKIVIPKKEVVDNSRKIEIR